MLYPSNSIWETRPFLKLLDYCKCLAQHGEGGYLAGHIDAHSNADALSALRGAQRFLIDIYDCPELVEKAMLDMRGSYAPIYIRPLKMPAGWALNAASLIMDFGTANHFRSYSPM